VNTPLLLANNELSSSRGLNSLFTAPSRTLGCAVLVAAINDYLSSDNTAHRSAEKFLYPKSPDFRKRYDWAVSIATGVDPEWLRNALDRSKPQWDQKRFEDELRARQQAAVKREEVPCNRMQPEPLQTQPRY
jgi:hypothetical protein